jgi:hypothetical protein
LEAGFDVEDVSTYLQLSEKIVNDDILAIFLDETASNAGKFKGEIVPAYQNSAELILNYIEENKKDIKVVLASTRKGSTW